MLADTAVAIFFSHPAMGIDLHCQLNPRPVKIFAYPSQAKEGGGSVPTYPLPPQISMNIPRTAENIAKYYSSLERGFSASNDVLTVKFVQLPPELEIFKQFYYSKTVYRTPTNAV
jgi:hypothetical protein